MRPVRPRTNLREIVGAQIIRARRMTPAEMVTEGWEGTPPVMLELSTGALLYPSQDEEGNGPGALFGRILNTTDILRAD